MSRPTLTAVNHYCLYPFNHGGSLGIRGLYKGLSEWFDINIITFSVPDCYPKELYINKHIKVINIVLPEKLKEIQNDMYAHYGMSSSTMVDSSPTVMQWYHKFPEIVDEVREISKNSVVVLAEHVFTWNLIKEACKGKHLWYRANNVEYDYKIDTWVKIGCPKNLLQEVYDIERDCCLNSEKILAVSSLEVNRFMSLYDLPAEMSEKFMNIHSGYDIDNLDTVLPSERSKIPNKYQYTGLFIASDVPHTRQAAEYCFQIARQCPDIQIVLLGSIGRAYLGKEIPDNIFLTGVVTEEEKRTYLKKCDFALNIMEDGAGINVKMFEYFAFGIPVIASAYGARGIEVTSGKDIILTTIDDMVDAVKCFCKLPIAAKDDIAKNALTLLKDKYSWRSISYNIANVIEQMYHISIASSAVPLKEIELYEFLQEDVYCPTKPFYIRCAGIRGRNCYSLMLRHGIKPIGFVDEDRRYIGKDINGIPVINVDEYLKKKEGTEIIVANTDVTDITIDLLNRGVNAEDISISAFNGFVHRLLDEKANKNSYYDASSIKKKILGSMLSD